ncbi:MULTISPECIES: GTPase HflX [unclassified Lactobacillus]|uniref:GTPase HflX n=1 Tax=unclassified Lactobacillus TaxID=2620435 RepID=UPI0018DC01BB|nr:MULTISPECIES: GTPase HflX [unclassified Lactobacillus]MBH9989345.1 GTPase HflX [Lactobacillus sp. M0392]MBI0023956.1 GTPase HflX [Lactobacillus sp. W8171]MBI0044386.1 GTPase HflX [Lactobacillus sp. M0393]
MIENTPHKTKAFIAGVNLNDPNFDYYMNELANLTEAANMQVVGQARQNAEHIIAGTYFGLGKINEIKDMARGLKAKVLVLNDELTPVQIRNLEKLTKLRVVDRTELILEIFSSRARTKQAKLQVQLAQLQYELPRLHPSENSLDQQRGNGGSTGGGFANRGAGETKLELNRRTIGKQISIIKKELQTISKQEEIKAKRRNQNHIPKVALVGYTNAGKSTTMNGLLTEFSKHSAKQVFVKNMLFATLDTNVRRIDLDNNFSFILSDTVGFISKLPHNLIESFKATLQEVKDADLLINVVDASDPNMIQMIRTTQNVLDEIGVKNTPMITAYNKADKSERNYPQIEGSGILYSAIDTKSIATLADLITKHIFSSYKQINLLLPLSAGKILGYLHENAQVLKENYQNDGIHVVARLSPQEQARLANYIN